MKAGRIKTDWASLTIADDGSAIICVKCDDKPCCVRFGSLEGLKQARDNRKISVKKWAVAIPRSSCILKPLALPASDLAEAAKMIEFEIPSLVPLPREKIVYGCTTLQKQNNMLNILVCILKLSTLNQHLEPYKAIGIEPHRITLNTLAIQNWFDTNDAAASEPRICVLVNKHHGVVLTFVNGNFHKESELAPVEQDSAISSSEIVREIRQQKADLDSSLKEKGAILLAGTPEYVGQVKTLLDSAPESGKVTVVANPEISSYKDGKYGYDSSNNIYSYEAIVAAGLYALAVNAKLPYSNLLPQQYVKRYLKKTLLSNYLLTAVLSVVLIILSLMSISAMNWRIEKMSGMIEAQIAPIEHAAGSVDSKRQRVKAIQAQLADRGQITRIVDELYKYTPRAISINQLKFSSKQSGALVEIKGQADLLSDAFEYTDAMSKAGLLNKIQIIDAQQIPRPGGSIVEFKANCVIQNG